MYIFEICIEYFKDYRLDICGTMVLIPVCERNMSLLQNIHAEYGTQPASRLPDMGGLLRDKTARV